MVKKYDILPLMIKDHCKLETLLDNLEKNLTEDLGTFKKSFVKFEWNVEKHIFLEEKVVFTSYNPMDIREGYKMLPTLTSQHNYILNMLKNWRDELLHHKYIKNISILKEFMEKHKSFEEKEFYPKLDQELSKD